MNKKYLLTLITSISLLCPFLHAESDISESTFDEKLEQSLIKDISAMEPQNRKGLLEDRLAELTNLERDISLAESELNKEKILAERDASTILVLRKTGGIGALLGVLGTGYGLDHALGRSADIVVRNRNGILIKVPPVNEFGSSIPVLSAGEIRFTIGTGLVVLGIGAYLMNESTDDSYYISIHKVDSLKKQLRVLKSSVSHIYMVINVLKNIPTINSESAH